VAVDGAGNVFVANGEHSYDGAAVFEIPAGGGPVKTVGFGHDEPAGVALDGAGNLFVAEYGRNIVVEIPAGCTNIGCQIELDGGLRLPYGIAVDGEGNLYISGSGVTPAVELPANCTKFLCAITIGTGFFIDFSLAVDGAGNVFISDITNRRVLKVPAGGGPGVNRRHQPAAFVWFGCRRGRRPAHHRLCRAPDTGGSGRERHRG
jgi:sugar lactone lactonase YvrE